MEVSADQVLVTNGAMQALDVVFRTLLRSGDEVLAPAPCFFVGGQVRRAGGRLVHFASGIDQGFRPDWQQAKALVTDRTRVLFVNTPVNPTGYVYDDEDLAAIGDLVESTGVTLVTDESSSFFVYGGCQHRSPALGLATPQNAVVIRSFSKDFALPGMRIGFAVLPEQLYEATLATLEWAVLCVNRTAQSAALAALTGPREWIDDMVRAAETRGAELANRLDAIDGLACRRPAGGLNVFPRFFGDAEELARVLAADFGVPAFPGSAFGLDGYFRVQFGGDERDLGAATERIYQAVASHVPTSSPPRSSKTLH
jgi:aspartate/methionine/tyrosine aminotransferase